MANSFAEMIYGTASDVAKSQGAGAAEAAVTGAKLKQGREATELQREELKQKASQFDATQKQNETKQAIQLAQFAEQMQLKRDQLDKQKLDLEIKQSQDILEQIKLADKTKDVAMQKVLLEKVVPARVRAYGLDSTYSQDTLDLLAKSPEARAKLTGLELDLTSRINNGELTLAGARDEFRKVMSDPSQLIGLDTDRLVRAEQFAIGQKTTLEAAKQRAEAGEKKSGEIQGRFEQSQKTKLVDKITALGLPSLKTAVAELDEAIPGGIAGYKVGTKLPGISGADAALPVNRLSGKALKIRGSAQSVANQILRMRSGQAVTDSEAGRVLAELGFSPVIGEGGTWTGIAWKGTTSPENFINGMRRANNMLVEQENTFRNAYGPEIYDKVSPPLKDRPKAGTVKLGNGRSYSISDLEKKLPDIKDAKLAAEITAAIKKAKGE